MFFPAQANPGRCEPGGRERGKSLPSTEPNEGAGFPGLCGRSRYRAHEWAELYGFAKQGGTAERFPSRLPGRFFFFQA